MTAAKPFPGASWLGALYAAGAGARRARVSRTPSRVCHLNRPVVSIGNLRVGGSGKTPLVAWLAEWLRSIGERPAILSRGYGRRDTRDVVIVSDGDRTCADVARAGDEPFMLARRLPGVAVVVGARRHAAGRVAEERCGATVHVLDDGFQHLQLARDLDIVLVSEDDVLHDRVLPAGRLREPVTALVHADAIVVMDSVAEDARAIARRWARPDALVVAGHRASDEPVWLEDPPLAVAQASLAITPCVSLTGIARPGRFTADLERAGWVVKGARTFADHHNYSASDIADIQRELARAGAAFVVTTEKDAVRLLRWRPLPFPVAWVPMRVVIEGENALRQLVAHALQRARDRRPPGRSGVPS